MESFGSSTENINDKESVKTVTVTESLAHESEEEMFKKKFGSIIIEEPLCGQKLI